MDNELQPYFNELKASLKAEMPVSEIANLINTAPMPAKGFGKAGGSSFASMNGTMLSVVGAAVVGASALVFALLLTDTEKLAVQPEIAEPVSEQLAAPIDTTRSTPQSPAKAVPFTSPERDTLVQVASKPVSPAKKPTAVFAAPTPHEQQMDAAAAVPQVAELPETPEPETVPTPPNPLTEPTTVTAPTPEIVWEFDKDERPASYEELAQKKGLALAREPQPPITPPNAAPLDTSKVLRFLIRSTMTKEELAAVMKEIESHGVSATWSSKYCGERIGQLTMKFKTRKCTAQMESTSFDVLTVELELTDRGKAKSINTYCGTKESAQREEQEERLREIRDAAAELEMEANDLKAEAQDAARELQNEARELAREAEEQARDREREAHDRAEAMREEQHDRVRERADEDRDRAMEMSDRAKVLEQHARDLEREMRDREAALLARKRELEQRMRELEKVRTGK